MQGSIKNRPEDFIVEEIPLYEPCGEGEHLYLFVRKKGMSHDVLIQHIAREFGVRRRDVGCAGRKDLFAITTQQVSVYLPRTTPEIPSSIGNIEVLSSGRHANKLRLGHLVGNRFTIRIRDMQCEDNAEQVIQIRSHLLRLATEGLPNAFGPQRFGNFDDNHQYGLLLLKEEWDKLVQLLLQGDDPCHEYVHNGDYKRALEAWPFGQPAQRCVLGALAKGIPTNKACMRIPKSLRKLWVNALQSRVFNATLEARIDMGTWNKLLVGDLVWNHEGGGRTFEALEHEIDTDDVQSRLHAISISPSGPLWGAKMRMPTGEALRLELETLAPFALDASIIEHMKKYASGARRPLRVPVGHPMVDSGIDQHGAFIEVRFDLPAGSYATVVIEHLLHASS